MIVDRPTRQRLSAETRFGDIRELGSVGSTNTFLLDLARRGAPEGVVVVADHQSAGRGRLGRRWQARPGAALLASILLRPHDLAPDRRHLVTAAVALAAADACRAVADVDPTVKWPNDLLVDDRKLAGILAGADGDAVVVGLGLNVGGAPEGAVSLHRAAALPAGNGTPGRSVVDRGAVLAGLLAGLEDWYGRWDDVAEAYRRRCQTVGRRVRAEMPGRVVTGWAQGLDRRGWLQVIPDGGGELVSLSAADVVHIRPGDTDRWLR